MIKVTTENSVYFIDEVNYKFQRTTSLNELRRDGEWVEYHGISNAIPGFPLIIESKDIAQRDDVVYIVRRTTPVVSVEVVDTPSTN